MLEPGTALPNGAIVLDCTPCGSEAIVLCIWPGHLMPFVTWRINPNRLDSTWLGNYHTSLAEAVPAYERRAK